MIKAASTIVQQADSIPITVTNGMAASAGNGNHLLSAGQCASEWYKSFLPKLYACVAVYEKPITQAQRELKKGHLASYLANVEEICNKKRQMQRLPYLAAVCFLRQKESAHTRPLHSSKFLYQRRWLFWSECRNIVFHPAHGGCGWECKWYWGAILLNLLWTGTRCVPPDTHRHFLPFWSGGSTGKSLTHPGGQICSVLCGQSSDLCLCEVQKENPHYS